MNKKIFIYNYKLLLILTIILLLVNNPIYIYASSIIVGYYPSWLRSTLPAEMIKYENLTHINHAFAWPETDGGISFYSDFLYPQLLQHTHKQGKKILVSLGGWGQSYGFSTMAANPSTRAIFIENITNFCITHGYDGIDIDWEHPATISDRNNLTLLVYQLRQVFNEKDSTLLITMAVTSSSWVGQWYDYDVLKNYVDWFGCMTYDIHGGWSDHAGHNSPLYAPANDYCGSVHSGIQYLNLTRRIPEEKILVGIPFYGKEFNASKLYGSSTGGDITYHYNEILPKINAGWTYHWDDVSKVPYLTNSSHTKLITFDDTLSVRLKCEYAMENTLKGVMIWALGQDVIGINQPLLETVGKTIDFFNDTSFQSPETPATFILLNNYPNPFNESTIIPFYVAKEDNIKLEIFNMLGKRISILEHGKKSDGWYMVHFSSKGLPSGVYFYRLSSSKFSKTRKMLLIK